MLNVDDSHIRKCVIIGSLKALHLFARRTISDDDGMLQLGRKVQKGDAGTTFGILSSDAPRTFL